MNVLFQTADDLLRRSVAEIQGTSPWLLKHPWVMPGSVIALFGMLYGITMGTYAGISPERWLHLTYTALKVPLLLTATFLLSWPSFAMANYLLGLGSDLKNAFRIIVSCQAVVSLALASLSPFTAFWYFIIRDYKLALLCNAAIFCISSLAGQYALRRSYQPLIASNRRHKFMLWVWIGLYSFVGIQLAWVLRPFVGSPAEAIQFIRAEELSNAYVRISALLWAALSGN